MSTPIFLQGPKGSFIIFDYIISILAIFGNSLILESVLKVQFDLTGYRRFLISLAFSDLYICFVNVITFVHSAVIMYSPDPELQKCGSDLLRSMQFCGFFANLLNLCGMSVDHFIGIVYPLRYCDFMTTRIARIAVASIWAVSLIIGFADYPISLGIYLTRSPDAPYLSSDSSLDNGINNHPNSNNLLLAGDSNNQNSSTFLPLSRFLRSAGTLPSSLPSNFNLNNSTPPITTAGTATMSDYQNGIGFGPMAPNPDDIMSDDIDAILSSIVGGSFPAAKFGISVNSSTKDRLKNILNLVVQPKKEEPGWCTILHPTRGWLEFSVMTMTLICFVFLSICYGRIFKEVFGNVDQAERNTRKLVITTFLLLGAFTICWMPFMVFEFIMIVTFYANSSAPGKAMTSSANLFIVHNVFNSMLICAPLIDPLIYSVRMRIVRRYILMRYKKLLPCCRGYIEKTFARRPTFGTVSTGPGMASRCSITATNFANTYGSSANKLNNANSGSRQWAAKTDDTNGAVITTRNYHEHEHSPHKENNTTTPLLSKSSPHNSNTALSTPAAPTTASGLVSRPPAIYTSGGRYKRQMRELTKAQPNSMKQQIILEAHKASPPDGAADQRRRGQSLTRNHNNTEDNDDATFQALQKTVSVGSHFHISNNSNNTANVAKSSFSDAALPHSLPIAATSFGTNDSGRKNKTSETRILMLQPLKSPGLDSLDHDDLFPMSPGTTSVTAAIEEQRLLETIAETARSRRCSLATPERSEMSDNRAGLFAAPMPGQADKETTTSDIEDDRLYCDNDDNGFIAFDQSPPWTPVRMKPIDFVEAAEVYRKFRGNAFRLFDFGDEPGGNAIMFTKLARQQPLSDTLPRKNLPNRVLLGKSPTLGDLATPSDDLLVITTDC